MLIAKANPVLIKFNDGLILELVDYDFGDSS